MEKLYYLFSRINEDAFSKSKCLEALYICDEFNYIDKPTYTSAVYSLGTMLSEILNILKYFLSESSLNITEDRLIESFKNSTYTVSEDNVFRAVTLDLLLSNQFVSHRKKDIQIQLLRSYMDYVELCIGNNKLTTKECLNLLCSQNNDVLPKMSLYYGLSFEQKVLLKSESEKLFSSTDDYIRDFNPVVEKKPRKLLNIPQEKTASSEVMKTPIYVFEIHDIVDFILAPLQFAIEQKFLIERCEYCSKIFIDNRKRKYCMIKLTKDKSCNDLEKLRRQLEREKSGRSKMEKSIRTMLANQYGSTDEMYRRFHDEKSEWRDKIKIGEATEEKYIEWLKTYFVRKYKDKKT